MEDSRWEGKNFSEVVAPQEEEVSPYVESLRAAIAQSV